MIKMDVETANAVLEALGCSSDPIFHRGKETTSYDLAYGEFHKSDSARIRIQFFSKTRLTKGTLKDMVKDRLEIR